MARQAKETSGETVVSQNVRIRVEYSNPTNPDANSLIVDNSTNNGEVAFGIGDNAVFLPNETALRLATMLRKMARG